MNKQTELEYHNEFIMYQGAKIIPNDCLMELVTSSRVKCRLLRMEGVWKKVNIDKFGEMFIVDDVGKKFNSKL
jgi:hypothetical protein